MSLEFRVLEIDQISAQSLSQCSLRQTFSWDLGNLKILNSIKKFLLWVSYTVGLVIMTYVQLQISCRVCPLNNKLKDHKHFWLSKYCNWLNKYNFHSLMLNETLNSRITKMIYFGKSIWVLRFSLRFETSLHISFLFLWRFSVVSINTENLATWFWPLNPDFVNSFISFLLSCHIHHFVCEQPSVPHL